MTKETIIKRFFLLAYYTNENDQVTIIKHFIVLAYYKIEHDQSDYHKTGYPVSII